MELKPRDAVRNSLNGGFGVVIKVEEGLVTFLTPRGERLTLMSRYVSPASPAEAARLRPLADWLDKEEARREAPRKPPPDPAVVRERFDKFIKHIAARYPASASAFLELWTALLAEAGDLPGETWEMRPDTAKEPGPVVKTLNPRSGKRVQCLHLYPGWALRLEIKKEHLPPGAETLFPIDNAMFGEGRAAEIIYARAASGWAAAYAAALRPILTAGGSGEKKR